MPTLTVNGIEVTVEGGATVLQACEDAGVEIPRFCYHERLSIAGNCRMCLVEMEKAPKPIASCAMPAGDGMVIHTDTETVKKAREGVMEFLLINHPLDCPVCDQGGECDLQDQAVGYGKGLSRYDEVKRIVPNKELGPIVKTEMTRCIHCMRCVRFATEVAGVNNLGSLHRGEHTEVTTFLEGAIKSEMSGNVVDLCPVGALTSKPYAFTARSWELNKTQSIDVMDAVGSNIRIDSRGNEVMRILPRLHEDVNEEWISDKTRYNYDGLRVKRLDRPWVKIKGKLVEASWEDAFLTVRKGLDGLNGSEISGVVGDMADMEAMYAFKDILNQLGSKSVECRQDGSQVEAKARTGYIFNSSIAGIEEADVCLLIGSNPRHEATLINTRLRKSVVENGLKVARIGENCDLTYPVNELGNNTKIISELLEGKHEFTSELSKAKKPMIIIGAGALNRADGKALLASARALAEKYNMVSNDWNGFNVLQTAASRVGGLDLGLTVTGGVAKIQKDAKAGKVKALFLLGADELDFTSFKETFTVYVGSHGDKGAANADVILPGAAFSEKTGLYTNTEGRLQISQKAIFPPGEAREDWTIFRALSDVLGVRLPYDNISELRDAIVHSDPILGTLDELPQAPWGDFGKEGKIKDGKIKSAIEDYFMTNPITRNSTILSDCRDMMMDKGEEALVING